MSGMESRDVKTKRGYNWHYRVAKPNGKDQTIVFLHGFPSSATICWDGVYQYFVKKGYGVILPDLLGYGGSDHPKEVEPYTHNGMAADIVDVINDAKQAGYCADKLIGAFHDWGCGPGSGLVYIAQDMFQGFAWFAVSMRPQAPFNYEESLDALEAAVGSPLFGYWDFFTAPDAPEVAEKNIDAFITLLYPEDPTEWQRVMAPRGTADKWVRSNTVGKRSKWMSEKEYEELKAFLLKNGLTGPMNYYTAQVRNLNTDPNWTEGIKLTKPNLFIGATEDYVCLNGLMASMHKQYSKDPVITEVKADHWMQHSATDDCNTKLEQWLESL